MTWELRQRQEEIYCILWKSQEKRQKRSINLSRRGKVADVAVSDVAVADVAVSEVVGSEITICDVTVSEVVLYVGDVIL
jgi:hypothetical protein